MMRFFVKPYRIENNFCFNFIMLNLCDICRQNMTSENLKRIENEVKEFKTNYYCYHSWVALK